MTVKNDSAEPNLLAANSKEIQKRANSAQNPCGLPVATGCHAELKAKKAKTARVIDNANTQRPCVIDNAITRDAREKLRALRDAFAMSKPVEDWRAAWWAGVRADDRRLILALAGEDDSSESAARRWETVPGPVREAIGREVRRMVVILEPMRWA